jgi:hypothetical protein
MRLLSWLWRPRCSHVWITISVMEGKRLAKRQVCMHCGRMGHGGPIYAYADSGGGGASFDGGGGGCDGG